MNSSDPDLAQAAIDFKKGGWIVSLLGIVGGAVAMLLSEEKKPWVFWLKRIIAGGLTGVIMFFSLHGVEMNPMYKSILMCSCGAVAPELLGRLRRVISTNEKKKRK
jgi:hypothetical protein